MWKNTEKKASVWTRLEVDCDIDELIFGEENFHEDAVEQNGSER